MKRNRSLILFITLTFSSCNINTFPSENSNPNLNDAFSIENSSSCFEDSSISNSNELNYSINYEIPFITEEEQYTKSDLVILIKANGIGNVEIINDKPYTIYYFSIMEFYKGNEEINFAYFYGNTTPESTISSSIDEKLIKDNEYKLYLRRIDDRFFTTSGFQSIIKK